MYLFPYLAEHCLCVVPSCPSCRVRSLMEQYCLVFLSLRPLFFEVSLMNVVHKISHIMYFFYSIFNAALQEKEERTEDEEREMEKRASASLNSRRMVGHNFVLIWDARQWCSFVHVVTHATPSTRLNLSSSQDKSTLKS